MAAPALQPGVFELVAPYEPAGDQPAAIDALDGVSATVNGAGQVEVATDRVGEDASIRFTSGPTNRDLVSTLGLPTTLVSGTEAAVGSGAGLIPC